MAKPPSWIHKVNFITKFISNPCTATWYLYFETALPAAGTAIVALLGFGLDDVIRGYFRPKNLRSQRHMRFGRKGYGLGFGVPEIGELIAQELPGAEKAKGRKVTQGVKNLWIIDGVGQKLFFWWMVIDVTTDFFYHWMSAIQKVTHCSASDQIGFAAHGLNLEILGIVGWDTAGCGTIDFEQGTATWNLATGTVPAGTYTMVFAATVITEPLIGASQVQARIRKVGGGDPVLASSVVALPLFASADIVVTATIHGPMTFICEIATFAGNAVALQENVFCQGG